MPSLLLILLILCVAGDSPGHGFAPSLLELREQRQGGALTVVVRWRDAPAALRLELPRCRALPPPEDGRLDCGPEGLRGAVVAVRGLDLGEEVLVRAELADGGAFSGALRAGLAELRVPPRASRAALLGSYLRLGGLHILTGYDHLLFLLVLLLLVRGVRALLLTVTAFTIAHSVTLCLAALQLLWLPGPAVEAVIALSVVFLAVELRRGAPLRRPWLMAFGFGLLHGLGFAGALREVGLPEGEIPLSLLGFNLGVEAGQLGFVGLVLPLRGALLRAARPLAYGIGALAALWCWQRVAAFWG